MSTIVFLSAQKEDSFCALRTLGEVYAVLTGLPVRPRITGADAIDILRQIRNRLTIVSLTDAEFLQTIEEAAGMIVGGAIYEALIARCAIKIGADVLLTFNERDFFRLGDDIRRLVKTPLAFQASG